MDEFFYTIKVGLNINGSVFKRTASTDNPQEIEDIHAMIETDLRDWAEDPTIDDVLLDFYPDEWGYDELDELFEESD